MRLSTPGAILIAGVLVLAGFLTDAAFPRYELKALRDGSLVRVDRWTATSQTIDGGASHWAATLRSPWRGRISVGGLLEGMVIAALAAWLTGWRARRALRSARVRRRLHHLVAADIGRFPGS